MNYFILGWHASQTNIVQLSSAVARKYNLRGIDDLKTNGIVNIKADNYYITYNLQRGRNADVEEYGNQVLIHKGGDQSFTRELNFGQTTMFGYTPTVLVDTLENVGDQFSVPTGKGHLVIRLCSIDTKGSSGVTLSIGLDAIDCNSPGSIQNPRGVETLRNGVKVNGLSGQEDDILEFRMEIPNRPSSVTCTTSGGRGDVDLVMQFMSSPAVRYEDGGNVVSD